MITVGFRSWILTAALFVSGVAVANAPRTFVIGAQSIDYYPHYDFAARNDKGFAWTVLEDVAREYNFRFVYLAMPIKRLQRELAKGNVDFLYPDNPKWHSGADQEQVKRHYSAPLFHAMGGTMVLPEFRDKPVSAFRALSVPFGFSPVMWIDNPQFSHVRIVAVTDAWAALDMVARERVSGADIEYHVARHQMRRKRLTHPLVLDPRLPYDIVGFHMVTLKYPEIIELINQYIEKYPQRMAAFRQRYQLTEADQILEQVTISRQ
ncbi:hypothetical protein LJ739_18275 [Aestuariibacter halophilus]|uniref:Solute-binding protein family 3/N-terminal domain-containing protein n=1 Tax=Fluctibacter halophilus TaxID=226011 RepID=A0ABS8GCB7_9ALTE|nr:hypothetical protein [Aestuariibacter halophilus]MCC2618209.1 hypothetical protein [Aestuariibacter halophilus]